MAKKATAASVKKGPKTFKMIESLSLRSTGRTVHMGTVVVPINEAEEAELLQFCEGKRPVCKQLVGAVAAPAAPGEAEGAGEGEDSQDGDDDGPGASDDLLAVPGIGKKTFEALKELKITTPDELKAAVLNPEKYAEIEAAVGAPNAAKWKAHFSPAADGAGTGGDADDEQLPRSSREKK